MVEVVAEVVERLRGGTRDQHDVSDRRADDDHRQEDDQGEDA